MSLSVDGACIIAFSAQCTRKNVDILRSLTPFRSLSLKAMRRRMSLAKEEAVLDVGFLWQKRELKLCRKREREEAYGALQYAASFHCLVEEWRDCEELKPKPKERWIFVDERREEAKHRTEWCAEANKYRCMRCRRSSKYMKRPGKCAGPKYLSENLEKWGKRYLGGAMIW